MSVYKRGKVWYYDTQVGGKRVKRATKATDRRGAEVEEVLAKKEMEGSASQITLQEAIMRCYKEEWQHNKDGLRTVNRTLKIVDIVGNIPLQKVDEHTISRLSSKLADNGLSPATINRYRAYLRKVLNVAYRKWRLIDRVPYIQNTKEVQRRFKVYTPTEEALIRENAPQQLGELVTVLLDTGLRLSEALGLRAHNLDLAQQTILIWADATKGEASRVIPMTDRVYNILHGRGQGRGVEETLFTMTLDAVEREWTRLKRKLGITDREWVLHALRHTFASRLVRKGVDLYTVQKLLGHSNITVTERYAHLNPGNLKGAICRLQQVDFGGAELHSSHQS